MKKFLKLLGVMVFIFVLMIGFSVMSLMKNGNKSTINASAEEVEAAVQQMGNGILDGGFYLDGKIYELPVMVSDLLDGGWVLDEDFTKQYAEFPANTVTNYMNIDNANDNQKLLSITLLNPYEEKVALEEVYIERLSISLLTANKIILPQGITWKSTLEEVEAAYGEPTKKSTDDTGASIEYNNETWTVTLFFDTDENGKTTMSGVNYSLND